MTVDTPEKGWGTHKPLHRVESILQLEIGGFYLCKSRVGKEWYYNVVEILSKPHGWRGHPEEHITYGRFVDPNDSSKRRRYSDDLFAIWRFELEDTGEPGHKDIYYTIDKGQGL
jgi:hypothetical protein